MRERERVCVCVCVCVRERERERESARGNNGRWEGASVAGGSVYVYHFTYKVRGARADLVTVWRLGVQGGYRGQQGPAHPQGMRP